MRIKINKFYFNLRLQKPSYIQCNVDNYRKYFDDTWFSTIHIDTAAITDSELKRYYREDIKDKNLYYEVEECNYNEEKAFKAGLIPSNAAPIVAPPNPPATASPRFSFLLYASPAPKAPDIDINPAGLFAAL